MNVLCCPVWQKVFFKFTLAWGEFQDLCIIFRPLPETAPLQMATKSRLRKRAEGHRRSKVARTETTHLFGLGRSSELRRSRPGRWPPTSPTSIFRTSWFQRFTESKRHHGFAAAARNSNVLNFDIEVKKPVGARNQIELPPWFLFAIQILFHPKLFLLLLLLRFIFCFAFVWRRRRSES